MIIVILITPVYFLLLSLFGRNIERPLLWFGYNIAIRALFLLCGIWIKVKGRANFVPQQTYVVVSNHKSLLDMFSTSISCPVLFKFLSKKELTKIPLFGYIITTLCILIDRSKKESRAAGVKAMEDALAEGMSIAIYPEGTRNRTAQPLKSMYDGAFRLAIKTQTPIIVQTILNANNLADPLRKLDLSAGIITTIWDVPVETKGMTLDDIEKLKEQVRQVMLAHLT